MKFNTPDEFKKNSLNTFRLLAALSVLHVHSVVWLKLDRVPYFSDFISFFSGVPIFFTLSGFLIWASIGRSKTFFDYAKKRFWRIYPELWVAVAVEIIVLLLLYHNPIDYPKLGLFILGQATIFQFWTPDFLRGYGCGVPNGALWTITVLIQFYLVSYFFYKFLHNKSITRWIWVLLLSILLGVLTSTIQNSLPTIWSALYRVSVFPYLWMFLIPAFVADNKNSILFFIQHYWWLFFLLLLFERCVLHYDVHMGMYNFFDTLLLFGSVVGIAYTFPRINLKTDISYGVYIYHMTVINALISLGFVGIQWTLWCVIILTGLLAWISTITIGKLSHNRKQNNLTK